MSCLASLAVASLVTWGMTDQEQFHSHLAGWLLAEAMEVQGRKTFCFDPLRALAGSRDETDKDRVIGEKHINLVTVSFKWHRCLQKEAKWLSLSSLG